MGIPSLGSPRRQSRGDCQATGSGVESGAPVFSDNVTVQSSAAPAFDSAVYQARSRFLYRSTQIEVGCSLKAEFFSFFHVSPSEEVAYPTSVPRYHIIQSGWASSGGTTDTPLMPAPGTSASRPSRQGSPWLRARQTRPRSLM